MPLILSEHNTAEMTDAQLLEHCVKEYANPSNYEPYEKDYGTGRLVERVPHFARHPMEYARQTLELLTKRRARPQPLTPMQEAYIKMHRTLSAIKDSIDFDIMETEMQDDIETAIKGADKWL